MLYFVGTLQDKTEVTCSHIMVREGKETIEVYFERPIYGGFDSARCILPNCKWMFIEGYSSQEIQNFESYMQRWEPQMFRLARYGERRMESIMEETQRPNEKTLSAIKEVQKMKEGSLAGDSYHSAARLIEDIVQTEASREMVGRSDFPEDKDLTDNEKIDMAAREILRRYRAAFEELAK